MSATHWWIKMLERIAFDVRLTGEDTRVVMALLRLNFGGPSLQYSDKTIAALVCRSVPSVRRSLDRLEECGHIRRETFTPTRECATGRIIHLIWVDAPAYLDAVPIPECLKALKGHAQTAEPSVTSDRGGQSRVTEGVSHPRLRGSVTGDRGGQSRVIDELDPGRSVDQKTPPNPPMGGKPEGGDSISSPGKAEDPGTIARPSHSKAVPEPAQQTPPVPPAPPEAARIKAEVRARAEAKGLPAEAASKLARKAEAAAIAGGPEDDIGEAVAAAVARWDKGDAGALSLVAVMLDCFDKALDRARRQRRANDPDATWEEIPKHRQDDFRAKARNIADDLGRHSAPDGGAAAAEFHAQAGQNYREVGVTGRAVREFERATGDPNPHCRVHSLPDELRYRAMIGFAWADWHLGRGERAQAAERLRAVAKAIGAHEELIEKENQERFARHRQHVAEEKARKEAEEAARKAFSETQRDAARHVSEAYERAGGKDRMGKVNAQHLSCRARTPEDVDRVRRLAELPPDQLVEIIDGIGRGSGGKSLDQMLAPQPPLPPPQPPAPPTPLERAKANAERLVDFRRSGGAVPIGEVVAAMFPQAATA